MRPKYRAALFDLDDTIFDHQAHRREALSAVARSIPELSLSDVRDLEAAHDVHLQRTHGAVLEGLLSVPEARTERMRGLLSDFGVQADSALANGYEKIYREAYDREWRTEPGASELLHSLRECGIWLGVITNGFWAEQSEKFQKLGLGAVVNELIVSELVGSRKPAREFFSHAVVRAGFPPRECVVVGDLWDIDIQGALTSGLDSIWLNRYSRTYEPRPSVIEINSFIPTDVTLRLFLNSEA